MNFVPCLTWVAKGIAKSCPEKLQLSPEELKNLIQESKDMIRSQSEAAEEASDSNISDDDEVESENEVDDGEEEGTEDDDKEESSDSSVHDDEKKTSIVAEDDTNCDEDADLESKYNLDAYDDDNDRPFMNIADVAVYVDNKEDKYITDYDVINEDEEEEEEDFNIKDSDNLLIVGHVEEESSVMEVHVYNKEEDSFYVHHGIVLPSYPLAIEWLDYHPADDTPGNYVAIGDMSPVIKIWDLDVVEIMEPEYCLGEEIKKKKKKTGEMKTANFHSDAVISLSWNKHVRNLLASGSADSTIIIWNLQEGVALGKLDFHTGKVQSLQWHPVESSFLASGCSDGLINVYDCRSPEAECKSWSVDGEIERVTWNLFDLLKLFCSTDKGFVHSIDLKKSEIVESIKAHKEGVTGLDMSQQCPNVLLTASMDRILKTWDIENGFKLIKSQKLKVGSIYTAKFAPDSEMTVAVGGNDASQSLKVLDVSVKEDVKPEAELNLAQIKSGPVVLPVRNKETNNSYPPQEKIKTAKKFKTASNSFQKVIKPEQQNDQRKSKDLVTSTHKQKIGSKTFSSQEPVKNIKTEQSSRINLNAVDQFQGIRKHVIYEDVKPEAELNLAQIKAGPLVLPQTKSETVDLPVRNKETNNSSPPRKKKKTAKKFSNASNSFQEVIKPEQQNEQSKSEDLVTSPHKQKMGSKAFSSQEPEKNINTEEDSIKIHWNGLHEFQGMRKHAICEDVKQGAELNLAQIKSGPVDLPVSSKETNNSYPARKKIKKAKKFSNASNSFQKVIKPEQQNEQSKSKDLVTSHHKLKIGTKTFSSQEPVKNRKTEQNSRINLNAVDQFQEMRKHVIYE